MSADEDLQAQLYVVCKNPQDSMECLIKKNPCDTMEVLKRNPRDSMELLIKKNPCDTMEVLKRHPEDTIEYLIKKSPKNTEEVLKTNPHDTRQCEDKGNPLKAKMEVVKRNPRDSMELLIKKNPCDTMEVLKRYPQDTMAYLIQKNPKDTMEVLKRNPHQSAEYLIKKNPQHTKEVLERNPKDCGAMAELQVIMNNPHDSMECLIRKNPHDTMEVLKRNPHDSMAYLIQKHPQDTIEVLKRNTFHSIFYLTKKNPQDTKEALKRSSQQDANAKTATPASNPKAEGDAERHAPPKGNKAWDTPRETPKAAPSGSAANLAKERASSDCDAEGAAIQRLQDLSAVIQDLGGPADALASKEAFRAWLAKKGVVKENKFMARKLVFGEAADSVGSVCSLLGTTEKDVYKNVIKADDDWLSVMSAEISKHGSAEDIANWKYIVSGKAQVDIPEHVKKDIERGFYHGGALIAEDYDFCHKGKTLVDFANENEAKLGELETHHVAALRLYTTSSYRMINGPLRSRKGKHPLPVTVYVLDQGLELMKKVRAKVDPEGFNKEIELWRGMSGVEFEEEFDEDNVKSGTEYAPMSTTMDKTVAEKYAKMQVPAVLFRYKASGKQQGVSLKFLSVYPKEEEFLYNPGTLLMFKEKQVVDGITVLSVVPQ